MSAIAVRRPNASDNKYSRGVVSMITGSDAYPGAALLSVGGALAVGIGMVRFLGDASVGKQVLQAYPEVVFLDGKTDCIVVGCGHQEPLTDAQTKALADAPSAVIDAGALASVDFANTPIASIVTPHFGELQKLESRLGLPATTDTAQAEAAATRLAQAIDRMVLLKGSTTYLAAPNGKARAVGSLSPWLATAGTGDVLAGILGALLAANRELVVSDPDSLISLAELAVRVHSRAAELAAETGPVSAHTLLSKIGQATLEFLA